MWLFCKFFWGVRAERITEVPKLADLTYVHTLVIKSTHEWKVGTIWPMDLVLVKWQVYVLRDSLRHYFSSNNKILTALSRELWRVKKLTGQKGKIFRGKKYNSYRQNKFWRIFHQSEVSFNFHHKKREIQHHEHWSLWMYH